MFITGGTAKKKDILQVLWLCLSDLTGLQYSRCLEVDSDGGEGIDDEEIPSDDQTLPYPKEVREIPVVLQCALCSSLSVY